MLKQHSQFALALLVAADALAVTAAWLASYWLRFAYLPVDEAKGVPGLGDKFLPMLPLVVLGHLLVFQRLRLYRPRRSDSLWRELRATFKAFVVAVVVVVLIDYALPQTNKISRKFIATYAVLGSACFTIFRLSVRALLRALRRRGWNRRYAAIIGSGRAGQRLLTALRRNTWTGIHVVYFVDDVAPDAEATVRDVPVLGPLSDLRTIVEHHPVDALFVALPRRTAHRLDEVLAAVDLSTADVRIVPPVNPAIAVRPEVTTLDGVPIVSVRQSPLYGSNALLKRAFDLVVGGLFLLVAALPMAVIALLIKRDSPGPVLYRQRRMGLDGREFDLLKFRTMRARVVPGRRPAPNAHRGLAAAHQPGRTAEPVQRPARGNVARRTAAGTPGVHRAVQAPDSAVHAPAQDESGHDRLRPDPRVARGDLPAEAHSARRVLHPQLEPRARHPHPDPDRAHRLVQPARGQPPPRHGEQGAAHRRYHPAPLSAPLCLRASGPASALSPAPHAVCSVRTCSGTQRASTSGL